LTISQTTQPHNPAGRCPPLKARPRSWSSSRRHLSPDGFQACHTANKSSKC
jgi:hypothetical protein